MRKCTSKLLNAFMQMAVFFDSFHLMESRLSSKTSAMAGDSWLKNGSFCALRQVRGCKRASRRFRRVVRTDMVGSISAGQR